MKDEVAPAEETRPQMPAISSGLPDRGRGGVQAEEREGTKTKAASPPTDSGNEPPVTSRAARSPRGRCNAGPSQEAELPRCLCHDPSRSDCSPVW